MGRSGLALAVIVSFIVLPVQLSSVCPATAGSGRADPPAGEWTISSDTNISDDFQFFGNITVAPMTTLHIAGAKLSVMSNGTERHRFHIMYGAALEMTSGAVLTADSFTSEGGAGLSLSLGSRISVRREFNATLARPEVGDSTIAVYAETGSGALLRIKCSSWGDFRRSNLLVFGGDGALGGAGGPAGAGGDATMELENLQLYECNLSALAGRGGDGGAETASPAPANGTEGAGGGNLSARLMLGFISACTVELKSGDGGPGGPGAAADLQGADGGRGGSGGSALFNWTGSNLLLSDAILRLRGGSGGPGGNGASAFDTGGTAGDGGNGGPGGGVMANISGKGAFTLTSSALDARAGSGGDGGMSGTDGGGGTAGDGGGAELDLTAEDRLAWDNCAVSVAGGFGGAGGQGRDGGKGGGGGGAGFALSVATVSAGASFALERGALGASGGRGGDGGPALPSSGNQGLPGPGGAGGRSELAMDAESAIALDRSSLASDGGAGGQAWRPAVPGVTGPSDISLLTAVANLTNSTASQTLGPVLDGARWTLQNTYVEVEPHFRIEGRGIAEEYWTKRVPVRDVRGKAIMDGSVTVEVRRNGTVVERARSSLRGETEFTLLDTLHTRAGAQARLYTVSAYDSSGRFSRNISAFWSPDVFIDLVLLQKSDPPGCAILVPGPPGAALVKAPEYLGGNGSRLPFIVRGEAADSPENDEPDIRQVQLRIGEAGAWENALVTFEGGRTVWQYAWDVYGWAAGELARYPSGIIPVTIRARSFNGFLWSDDRFRGGNETSLEITVWLPQFPPPPPVAEITLPRGSTAENPSVLEAAGGRVLHFDARLVSANGTRITRWAWCMDDSDGYVEDFSSPLSPATSWVYPKERQNRYFFAVLKVFDNASQRRVELLAAGVPYQDFGYGFDPADGSAVVKLKVYLRPEPAPAPAEDYRAWLIAPAALAILAALLLSRASKKKQIEK